MGAKTGDGATQVLFVCSPDCGRVRFRPDVAEGRVAPYEGPNATTWEVALEQAHREGLMVDGLCTNWRMNGANKAEGWCFLNMTGGKKETAPVR